MDNPSLTKKFVEAARRGDSVAVRKGLEEGIRADREYGSGWHPMILAAEFGFNDLVEKFHKDDIASEFDYTEALHIAAENGHRDLVYQILKYGFDPTSTTHLDLGMAAAIGGQLELLREFDRVGIKTDYTCPILMEAIVEQNHGAVLDFILDKGAKISDANDAYNKFAKRDGHHKVAAIRGTLDAWADRGKTIISQSKPSDTLSQLRDPYFEREGGIMTGIMRMTKAGRFREVVTLARQSSDDFLTLKDLQETDRLGNSVLEILGERGELHLLVDKSLWRRGIDELAEVYHQIPDAYKGKLDIQPLVAEHHRHHMKRKKAPTFKK